MAANRGIASAIEDCYDAAFEFGRWPQALQNLADSLGVSSCVIRTRDDTHPFRSDQRKRTRPTPDSLEHHEFAAIWLSNVEGAPDPHPGRAARLPRPATCFTVEDEISTPEERRTLPYYQEIARPGHREWWGAVAFPVKRRQWVLSMFRDARIGPFDLCEADHFLRVVPDLARIISLAEKIWEVSLDPALAVLDQFNCAAALLDSRGCLRRCNKHADALFDAGLVARNGHIHAADRESDSRLQRMILAAVASARDGTFLAEPEVVARGEGSFWLLAEIVPMTSFVRDLFNGGDFLLCFSDLVSEKLPSERLLGQAFQLTVAEARLASSLAAGEGIEAASARLEIGRETARTQLRAILAKTGTHRQAELTALIARLRTSSRY